MTTVSCAIFQLSTCCAPPGSRRKFDRRPKAASHSSDAKPLLRDLPRIPALLSDVSKLIKKTSVKVLDALVDHVFEFVDQPYLPSQSNFAPVDEIGEAVQVTTINGRIPDDFPEGVYLRNGANPGYGGLKSAISIFGKSSHIWVEGQGMIHAFYFNRDQNNEWTTIYNNKYVRTETSILDKQRNKPALLPAVEGDSAAVLSSIFLNWLRFGQLNENLSNTNVFEHSGKYYSISEVDMPQEIDIHTLETLDYWDTIKHSWKRNFTSHPKRAPETGELITFGADAEKPHLVVGVISADGTKLIHNVDLKFDRSIICHDIGVTQRYNIILDFPIVIDPTRLFFGGSLIKYEKESFARIGVMPRYGDANSVQWFGVEPCCAFHIINCYEEGDEVVVMACRSEDSVIPGPELGIDKFDWFSKGFKHINSTDGNNDEDSNEGYLFSRPFMWRLNMRTGIVKQKYLLGTDQFSMDFPMINDKFTGLKNKYAFTQVVDSDASSAAAMPKFGGLAKLYLEDKNLKCSEEGKKDEEEFIKVDYHMLPENTFCTGSAFIAKNGAVDEDDGWIITFTHNETTNISQVYIVDAKNFSSEPVARITLPCRVPYGFHGAFMPFGSK